MKKLGSMFLVGFVSGAAYSVTAEHSEVQSYPVRGGKQIKFTVVGDSALAIINHIKPGTKFNKSAANHTKTKSPVKVAQASVGAFVCYFSVDVEAPKCEFVINSSGKASRPSARLSKRKDWYKNVAHDSLIAVKEANVLNLSILHKTAYRVYRTLKYGKIETDPNGWVLDKVSQSDTQKVTKGGVECSYIKNDAAKDKFLNYGCTMRVSSKGLLITH